MIESALLLKLASYLLLGVASGLIGGMLGLGGGIVIVPALLLIFIKSGILPGGNQMHLVVGTSLACIIFTAISASYAHHRRGAVLWPVVKSLIPGIIIGGLVASVIAEQLHSNVLRTIFGLFEILVAIQIAIGFKPAAHHALPQTPGMVTTGGVIGFVSALLGIGGGTLTVPFLVWCNVNIRNAVATSSACGLPIAISGVIGFIATGWGQPGLPAGSTGFVYWPAVAMIAIASVSTAPIGAKLAHTIPVTTLKKIFAVVLAAIGTRMLF